MLNIMLATAKLLLSEDGERTTGYSGSPVEASRIKKLGGRLNPEELQLREYRRRNLDYALRVERTTPQQLAKRLACETNYISQLRQGHRSITFETARKIEQAEGWSRLSLDSPPQAVPSEPTTEAEIQSAVTGVLREICKAHRKPTRGALFDAMLKLCVADAIARGYNEGRVRFIAGEFFK